jgi:hypothetical protein
MMRFILPLIIIGIGVTIFFTFSNPMYVEIGELRAQAASYDEALLNSKALENERDKLTQKDNAIDPEDKIKLRKLLPDTVDNIRLILEIEKLAMPYGMLLKDVKYNATLDPQKDGGGAVQAVSQSTNKEYGSWDLEFSTTGTYGNFLNFMADLEKNLRIVDVSSIDFSSETGAKSGAEVSSSHPSLEVYKYDFKIKTYWLKK